MFSSKALILAKLVSSFSVAVDKAEIETIISYQDKDTKWLYAGMDLQLGGWIG